MMPNMERNLKRFLRGLVMILRMVSPTLILMTRCGALVSYHEKKSIRQPALMAKI